MKTFRYRKDLTSYHFEVKHKFLKGFNRLYSQGRIRYHIGDLPVGYSFSEWYRPAAGVYEYAGLSSRTAEIVIISNTDFRKTCDYIYTHKQTVVRVLFEFSALAISAAGTDIINHRFPYRTIQCLGIERKLFKHSLKSD
jgi:hypothetical protein